MKRAFYIFAALVVVALTIGVYKAKSDAAKAAAHVHQLEAQIAATQADMRALRAEIAERESPANVEALTRSRTALEPGREAQALPESAMDQRLPPPRNGAAHP